MVKPEWFEASSTRSRGRLKTICFHYTGESSAVAVGGRNCRSPERRLRGDVQVASPHAASLPSRHSLNAVAWVAGAPREIWRKPPKVAGRPQLRAATCFSSFSGHSGCNRRVTLPPPCNLDPRPVRADAAGCFAALLPRLATA